MQIDRGYVLAVALRAVLLVPLALELMGCRARPAEWPELGSDRSGAAPRSGRTAPRRDNALRIEPLSSQEVADLSPDDIVLVARRIGFTDQQILDLGPDLHNALLLSGAARVVYKQQVEALLRVQGDYLLIYSNSRGYHMYNLSSRGFNVIGPPRSSR